MNERNEGTLNRREFLKTSGTVAALALVGKQLFAGPSRNLFKPTEKGPQASGEEVVYSWCRQCALPPCGIKVKLKDGVAVKVEGNPDTPTNAGTLCTRGNATIAGVYNPYRVKTPLKRTNPNKGIDQDPGWVEITWEEALDTIAAELKRVRADDPRKFIWFNGFARSGSMLEGMEFCAAYGTPNYIEVDGPNCSVHFGASLLLGNFVGPRYDPVYTKFLIQIGNGANATQGYAPNTQGYINSIAGGMKVVNVDPKLNAEGSKGEWVPIRPGSDLAFVLAFQNTILHELKQIDLDFIKNRTNAPYLIGPDRHYVRDPESGKPLMWDGKESRAKPFDDPAFAPVTAAPAGPPPAASGPPAPPPTFEEQLAAAGLTGKFEINGVTCQPAFQIYMNEIKSYTPEWAEGITTVSAATTRRLAKQFVSEAQIGQFLTIEGTKFPYRPVCLAGGRGAITQFYGGHMHAATIITNMLVGALDVPGAGRGDLGPSHKCTPINMALTPDADGIVAPKVEAVPRKFNFPPDHIDGKTFFPYSHDNPHIVMDAILDPKKHFVEYEPELMFVWAGNMVLRVYQPEKALAALNKMKFIFALSYSIDEPAWMADIVLPEAVGLERTSASTRGNPIMTPAGMKQQLFALVAQQAIDRVYDSRQPDEVFIDLAERVGILYGPQGVNALINTNHFNPVRILEPYLLDENTKYTPKELANRVIKSTLGETADVDAYRSASKGPVTIIPYKAWYPALSFPVGTSRYGLYMENLLSKGEELCANLDKAGAHLAGFTDEILMQHYYPVNHWIEKPDNPPAEFDLYAINWKTAQYSFGVGGSAENPWLEEVSQFDPFLHVINLNPKTAQSRKLLDGDVIWVESPYGKVKGKVKTTHTIHPEAVGIAGFFGHTSPAMAPAARKGLHFNSLMSPRVEDVDPLGGGFDGAPRVKIYKA